jgi:hypothetical protein
MLPGIIIKEKFYYRNIAINIVTTYYYFQKREVIAILRKRLLI